MHSLQAAAMNLRTGQGAEGRAILANIRKFLRYLLSSNIGGVLTMFFVVLQAQCVNSMGIRTSG
jgi:P-type Ca2+ transporter type 2C